ncbi:hypothetical protein [Chryseobacterium sp.]|uniref:hypothetical protein n=1 Tax=Chryseobacterium sp. TaxID=1871047 RepID=UPI00333FE51C
MNNKNVEGNTKLRSAIAAFIIILAYSYFVPGWRHISAVRNSPDLAINDAFLFSLLMVFYLFHYFILYKILEKQFSVKTSADKPHVSSLLVKNPFLKLIIFFIVGLGFLLLCRNIAEPFKNDIGIIFRAKNAFLEILTTLPFILLYVVLIYFYFHCTSSVKSISVSKDNLTFTGSRHTVLLRKEIKEIHIIEIQQDYKIFRLLFHTKNKNTFLLNPVPDHIVESLQNYWGLLAISPIVSTNNAQIKKIYKL